MCWFTRSCVSDRNLLTLYLIHQLMQAHILILCGSHCGSIKAHKSHGLWLHSCVAPHPLRSSICNNRQWTLVSHHWRSHSVYLVHLLPASCFRKKLVSFLAVYTSISSVQVNSKDMFCALLSSCCHGREAAKTIIRGRKMNGSEAE